MFDRLFKPKTPNAYREKALDALRSKNTARALQLTAEALERFPDAYDAWETRVQCLAACDRAGEARESAQRFIEKRPGQPDGWFLLGHLEQNLHQLASAEQAYAKAVEVDPTHLDSWVNLGVVRDEQGNHQGALAAYDKALALAPNDPTAWRNRGNSLRALAQFNDAARAYEKALSLGEDVATSLRRALAYAGDVGASNRLRAQVGRADSLGELRERRADVAGTTIVARYFIGRHSNPELLDAVVDMLIEFAVTRCQEHGFADGHTLSLPWSRLTARQRGEELVLEEPDWTGGKPADQTLPEVTFTAQQMVLAKILHDLVGEEPVPVDFRHTMRLQPEVLTSELVVLYREKPSVDGESGWVAFCDPDNPRTVSVPFSAVVAVRPHLTKAITMPVGFRVYMREDRVLRVTDATGTVRFSDDS